METSFGNWLKEWRTINKFSSRQVAILLGVSQTYIWKIENDKVSPSLRFLRKFANVFETPEVYLAAGRLVPDEEINKTGTGLNIIKEFLLDQGSSHLGQDGFEPTLIDDSDIAKFMIDIYQKLKSTKYDEKDLVIIRNFINSYFSSKGM